jgi:hypothetical protein
MSKVINFTITRPVAVDTVSINLPYYCRQKNRDWLFYCITEDETVIEVLTGTTSGLITMHDRIGEILNNFDMLPITRDEFIRAFVEVTDSLTKALPYDGHHDN